MTKTKLHAENSLATLSVPAENVKVERDGGKASYNPEFVEKILKGREDIRNGRGVKINIENLWD